MIPRPTPPPRPAERLLQVVLGPGEWTDAILGDLHEEHAVLARTHTARTADAWYWSHAMRLVARYGARAAARRMTRPDLPVQPMPAGDSLMRTLGLETRHALRALIKRPMLSLIVIGTLSLGLGANAAVLAMIDALVIRPFAFSDIDRIALVSQTSREHPADRRGRVAPANFIDWKKQTDVFERLAAFEWWDVNLIGRDVPERVQGFFVSADFFPALGVRPDHGRSFLPEEETVGRHRAAVLGHGLWQRRFGGDPAIVGQKIILDEQPYEVVGVAPAGFDFPMGSEVWAPLAFTPKVAELRTSHYLTAVARIAPGRTLEDAQAQMAVVAERLESRWGLSSPSGRPRRSSCF